MIVHKTDSQQTDSQVDDSNMRVASQIISNTLFNQNEEIKISSASVPINSSISCQIVSAESDVQTRQRTQVLTPSMVSLKRKASKIIHPTIEAVKLWQLPEIIEWLNMCDLDDFAGVFSSNHFDGSKLLALTATKLLEIGIQVSSSYVI
jgi:hypothetical protein